MLGYFKELAGELPYLYKSRILRFVELATNETWFAKNKTEICKILNYIQPK